MRTFKCRGGLANDGSSASEMVSVHSMKLSSWGSLHSRSPEGSDGAAPAQRQSLP